MEFLVVLVAISRFQTCPTYLICLVQVRSGSRNFSRGRIFKKKFENFVDLFIGRPN